SDLGRKDAVDGFVIQQMASGVLEVFAGVKRDPDFGLVLAFGAGGVLIEAFDDVALRPLPLREGDAAAMIAETRAATVLAGFRGPTSGVIELAGEELTRRKPYERNIGVVFQNYALFPHMTVARNVAFPLRMRRFPRADQAARVRDILALVGLSEYAERHP